MSLQICIHRVFATSRACRAIQAAKSIGLPYIPDLNAPTHPPFACGRLHFTIDENSHRHSAYHAFLPKDLALARRDRLHICTNTTVERLETERTAQGELIVTGVTLGPREEGKRGRKRVTLRPSLVKQPWTGGVGLPSPTPPSPELNIKDTPRAPRMHHESKYFLRE